MKKPVWQAGVVLVAALGLLLGACTSSDDTSSGDGPTTTGGEEPSGELGTGVTEDSIKLAFSYVDLAAVREATGLDIDHGPYDEIMEALVADLNENGGVNGRTVDLVVAPYNPSGGDAASLAACVQATEDEEVFAVLGGLRGDTNLCIVEQHETVLVGGDQNAERLERARAPWATWEAAVERSVRALVGALDEEGELEGRTIAVYGLTADQVAIDAAMETLAEAGVEVAFEAVNDADGADRAAVDAQDATLIQRMEDEGVDAVVIAGRNVPTNVFDQAGYYPRLWISNSSIMSTFASELYLEFPDVFTVGGPPGDIIETIPAYEDCVTIYEEASGEEVLSVAEAEEQGENPVIAAMSNACTALQIFKAAAEAAGDTLNQSTFLEGLESLGDIELAASGDSSFGPDKYDAPTAYYLFGYNPEYAGLASGIDPLLLRSDEPFELEGS